MTAAAAHLDQLATGTLARAPLLDVSRPNQSFNHSPFWEIVAAGTNVGVDLTASVPGVCQPQGLLWGPVWRQ